MSDEEGSDEERLVPGGAVDGEQDRIGGIEDPTIAESKKTKGENEKKKKKKKERKIISPEETSKRGVCYLSRIPPNMDPASLRHMLSQYGEIDRIYLSPTDPTASQGRWKKSGGARAQAFSEGWVEFLKKGAAKRVANMLNGEQMGGRRRSSFYYDIWNIKYLRKFKWDDLTEEIAYKSATREQKLALEISAAKKERNYTLSKFAQARAVNAIEERLKKKRKNEDVGLTSEEKGVKIYRQFSQNRPLDKNYQKKGTLSKDILAGVFSNSSL